MPKRGQGRKFGDSSSEDGSMPGLIEGQQQHAADDGSSTSSGEARRPAAGFRPRAPSGNNNNNSNSSSDDDGPPGLTQRRNAGLELEEDFVNLPSLVERDLVESSEDDDEIGRGGGHVPPVGNNNFDGSGDENVQRGVDIPLWAHSMFRQAVERERTERQNGERATRQQQRSTKKKGKKKK